ncbi:hypothetical protein AALP_AA8G476400 [Arabis alpina]|uniref:Uncharacterized protein n=1 Tax=Arabis alpina TaxID=50452 RepID=A0A087GE29_ARAAL|nr:hypothetical protein AALP_AA8G476400 [Arabis alpina]
MPDKLEEEEEIEEEEESEEEEDEEEKIELHYGSVTVKNAPAGANYRFQKQTDFQPQAVASWTQPNQTPPQSSTPQNNASLFQVSHNLEFQGGGSFSLGSSGVCYKSGRII